MVVLLNQYLGTNGLGNINPTLYTLAATSGAAAFHPATTGDNKVYCVAGQPVAPWPTALQCPTAGLFGWDASVSDSATGYNLVTGLGSVDANNMAVNWNTASATAGATFTITPAIATFSVAQGSAVTAAVNVIVPAGFSGTIVFTCTDPAPSSTCTVPASVTASGTVNFSVSTSAASAALRPADGSGEKRSRILYAALLPGLLGVMFTSGSRRRTARGMRLLGLVIVLAFSTLWLASCGGGSSSGGGGGGGSTGTTAGSYNITVTGTSGSTVASTSFQMVVQ
jgi:hypothetical protein